MKKDQEKRLKQMSKAVRPPFADLFKHTVEALIDIWKELKKSDKQVKAYLKRTYKGKDKAYGEMLWYVYSGQKPKIKPTTKTK